MEHKRVDTYYANIYVGMHGVCQNEANGFYYAEEICQNYVDEIGLCVTITKTKFTYTDGGEEGVIVGLINYPRFPSSEVLIREKALTLATLLKAKFKQQRVSIVFPDYTLMLEG